MGTPARRSVLGRSSVASGEFPLRVHPNLESGCLVPDSVDLAGHRGVGTPARRSVLGRSSVAQRRVTVSMIMFAFEVADHHPGFEQGVPMVAVEALAYVVGC